jgi:hypothetical protein
VLIVEPAHENDLKVGWNVGLESVEADLEIVPGKLEWGVSHRSTDLTRVVTLMVAGSEWVDTSLFALMDLLTRASVHVWNSDPPAGQIEVAVAVRGSSHTLYAEPQAEVMELGVRRGSHSTTFGFAVFDYENTRVALHLQYGRQSFLLSAGVLLRGLANASSLLDSISTFQQDIEWAKQLDRLGSLISGKWTAPHKSILFDTEGRFVEQRGKKMQTGLWELRQAPYGVGRLAVALIKPDNTAPVGIASLMADGTLQVRMTKSLPLTIFTR